MKKHRATIFGLTTLTAMLALLPVARAGADGGGGSFLEQFHRISTLASTVPANGDVNPYGVAVVPRTIGALVQGNVLVSNFNNGANLQGTGTTIVQIAPGGAMRLFAHIDAAHLPGPCPGGIGLTTALVVLRSGWVIVGSLPTTDGTAATAQAGCLLVLNSLGRVVETFSGALINGPWDMTVLDQSSAGGSDHDGQSQAVLFVTNVLNGTVAAGGAVVDQGTVVRLSLAIVQGQMPRLVASTVIASGFPERTDPAALVIGPTGLGLASSTTNGSPSLNGHTEVAGARAARGDHGQQGSGDHGQAAWYYHPASRAADQNGNGTLYVADSLDNRVAAISNALTRSSSAGTGTTISSRGALNDPLGLAIAPNGDILTVNGNDGNAVETTPNGVQVAIKMLDSAGSPPGAGALFGLAVVPGSGGGSSSGGGHDDEGNGGLYFVDDASNTLNLLH